MLSIFSPFLETSRLVSITWNLWILYWFFFLNIPLKESSQDPVNLSALFIDPVIFLLGRNILYSHPDSFLFNLCLYPLLHNKYSLCCLHRCFSWPTGSIYHSGLQKTTLIFPLIFSPITYHNYPKIEMFLHICPYILNMLSGFEKASITSLQGKIRTSSPGDVHPLLRLSWTFLPLSDP